MSDVEEWQLKEHSVEEMTSLLDTRSLSDSCQKSSSLNKTSFQILDLFTAPGCK